MRKSLLAALEKHKLKEIPALGEKFDPTVHEAISVVDADDWSRALSYRFIERDIGWATDFCGRYGFSGQGE